MPLFEQIPVRLQASIVSNPPIDANTGMAPKFWRAQSMALGVAIFDGDGVAVDLSNIEYLQLTLQPLPTSLVPSIAKSVLAADIIPTITRESWLNGSNQQATFLLTNAEMDLSLNGETSLPYWLTLVGFTTEGEKLIYSAGYVDVFDAGTILPIRTQGVVSADEQTNTSGNFTVDPGAQVHHEEITVNGSASTRKCVVNASGLYAGAIVALRFRLPATAAIVIQIYDQSVLGDLLTTFQTDPDGYTKSARVQLWYDGSNFQRDFEVIPASGQST